MNIKKYLLPCLAAVLLIASCKKAVTPAPNLVIDRPVNKLDVYVVGYNAPPNGDPTACYWKNGGIHTLSTPKSKAYGISISDTDIYIAGYVTSTVNNSTIATLWKNGVPEYLQGNSPISMAYAVTLSGVDVYVSGYTTRYDGSYAASYWKNGLSYAVNDAPLVSSIAYAIAIDGQDVYIAGETFIGDGTSKPTWWKNGVPTYLTPISISSAATGIAVKNGDVYLSGNMADASLQNHAAFWKNTQFTQLATDISVSGAWGITLKDNDVYIAGTVIPTGQSGTATYWKNGTVTTLNDGQGLNAVAFNGTDMYTTGSVQKPSQKIAAIWINDTITPFLNIDTFVAEGYGIAFIQH